MKQKTNGRKVIPLCPLPDTRSANHGDEAPQKKVAAYCRVSSESEEQLHSVKAQIDYYQEYISSNEDYEYVGIYADEGISGTGTLRREAFNRLMADCGTGLVDIVITKSVSRFGRNTVDTLKNVRELKALGVDVFFEKENIHTMNSEGEVLLTLISAVAQNESLSLSENVKWGIRRKYENGSVKSVPCGKFLGYDKIDGELIINEKQAVVVRRIYYEFLSGSSFSQIAAHLTEDGILSEQGNAVWNLSSVRQILTNEKFKGDTLFQKTYNTDHLTKKRADNKGELPQYYIEDSHPAIIDKDAWECVRLELERQEQYCRTHRISKYHNHNKENPLSARITCSVCGSTYMLLKSKRVGEKNRKYWRCSSFRGKHGTEVARRTFTPPPMALWSKYPDSSHAKYRSKHRKLPEERQMFCTDIQIPADAPKKAFVKAWNLIVSHRLRYASSFHRTATTSLDILVRYRANEMIRLLSEVGQIKTFDYELSLIILDHIEVTPDGRLAVIFLAGTKITC
jgi:site-specific DNA recombinase